jgi:hypothetical protein
VNSLAERIERLSIPEPNTGCWLYLGALGKNRYGTIGIGKRKVSAHRASYEAHLGEIPLGKIILHKCDTKACVNPSHLLIGTHHDNAVDRSRRSRKDPTSSEQRYEWGVKGGARGSWGLGLGLKERLARLSAISESGCRVWIGTVTKSTGYGEIKVKGRKTTAHRAAWIAHNGEIQSSLVVMHACDNRLCINLDHLSVGTRRDNMIDMSRKRRGGFDNLSTEQRREMSKRAQQTIGVDGHRDAAAARLASMSPEQRSAAVRKGWKLLTPEQRNQRSENVRSSVTSERRSEIAKNQWTSMTPEQRSETSRKLRASMSTKQLSERAQKIWANRRAKYGQNGLKPKENKLDAELVPFVRHWNLRGHSIESIALAFNVSTNEVERAVA